MTQAKGQADPFTIGLEPDLAADEFRGVLVASGLNSRRPADDLDRLERMLRAAQIVVAARRDGLLVGVSRAITDFCYCCYLSDLAVDQRHQRKGLGRRLIAETHRAAGPETSLFLISAPGALTYYPHVGLRPFDAFGVARAV